MSSLDHLLDIRQTKVGTGTIFDVLFCLGTIDATTCCNEGFSPLLRVNKSALTRGAICLEKYHGKGTKINRLIEFG